MPLPVNIKDLINQRIVESTRIEYKEGFNLRTIVHTICAFANDIDNSGGGYVIVGVAEENGRPSLPPKGLDPNDIDQIMKRLIGLCRCIEPVYNPFVEPVEFQGAQLLVIWVPGGHGRPYKACKDVFDFGSAKEYYIRRASSTIRASHDEEKDLFYIASSIPFDDRENLAARVDDMDIALMRSHLKETGSDLYERSLEMDIFELAEDMRLIAGPPENPHPLNVGTLMFAEDPTRWYRYAYIDVAYIHDPAGKLITEKRFDGPIQRQLKDALAYLRNAVVEERIVKVEERAEALHVSNYPFAAIEEVLTNAVYHRSYQIHEPITVRITPLSIEIISFPGFSRSIREEDIAGKRIRARAYRNRRIGDFLKELGLTEGHNTGFPNAFSALEANGSGELLFEMDEERSFLSVTIPIHPAFIEGGRAEKTRSYEANVIAKLTKSPLTLTELAQAMGYKGITKKLNEAVSGMLRQGRLIALSEPGKRGQLLALPSSKHR